MPSKVDFLPDWGLRSRSCPGTNKERALDNVENAKQFRLEMHVNQNENK